MANELKDWPAGLCVELAVLRFTVETSQKIFGVKFKEDYDDLDYFDYAIIRIEDFKFALIRYRGSPLPGITLLGIENLAIDEQLRFFLKHFKISKDKISWSAS